MLRSTFILILATFSLALPALETPLVLRPPGDGSDYLVVVNAGIGTMQLYRANDQRLEQRDAHNFLADIENIQKRTVPGRPTWPLLRVGSTTTTPTYTEMMEMYPKPSRGSDNLPLAQRALNTEDEFWSEPRDYDGIVRGAMLNNALVLILPSSYTMLFYTIMNDEMELAGWRNYRLDLYVPQVLKSTPTPQELLRALPKEIQEERKDALEAQMEELGESASEIIPITESDPWIASNQTVGQLFILVDAANNRLMTYQFQTRGNTALLNMQSVRNLEMDLMIPTTYKSTPDVTQLIKNYNQHLGKAGLAPVTAPYVESLLNQQAITARGASKFHALIDPNGLLVLDFPEQRQLLTYRSYGAGGGSELVGARDYTVEAGIGIHRVQLQRMEEAKRLVPSIKSNVRKNPDEAFRIAGIVLEWNPWLYEKLEKDFGRSLGKDERWQPLIETAIAEVERREAEAKAIAEEAERRAKEAEERRNR